MNDSSTGGPMLPEPPPAPGPLEDGTLDQFIQQLVVVVTGLDGSLVRPRWQEEPPDIPAEHTDWCAIGITNRATEAGYPVLSHHPELEGFDEFQRHESLSILASFYGPGAGMNAGLLRDGLFLSQHREILFLAGMGLVNTGDLVTLPALLKQRWLRRVDLPLVIRRAVQRYYPIRNLLSAAGTVLSDEGARSATFNTLEEK